MRRVKLIFVTLGAVMTLSSFANAQVPDLLPIPNGLDGHQREELAARRSQLEAQWNTLVSKVEDHNRKCGKVPVNTPLANECRQRMSLLQGEIAAHIRVVKSFNDMSNKKGSGAFSQTQMFPGGKVVPPANIDLSRVHRWPEE